MRADRLLSLLMLLQSRPQMSASDLADELVLSVRTIYRDIDALCTRWYPILCLIPAAERWATCLFENLLVPT